MSNLSRRTLVTGAASVAAAPTMSAVPTVAVDDTLARIQEHRTVTSKIGQLLHHQAVLEEAIPYERRESGSIADRGTDVGANDDPRWTEYLSEYRTHEDRVDEIAWSFVDRPPSSVAAIQALLSYAGEHEAAGYLWPDARHHFEDRRYAGYTPEDWRSSLMEAISHTLAHAA